MLILLAILSAGMGIKGYLLSSHFIDGGVTGISMLLNDISGWPLSILIPLINLPFIVLAYYQLGIKFAVKTVVAIAGLAICLAFVPYPDVTADKLLTALFGGFFIGLGIGLAIRAGAVLDGTEIAALLVSKNVNFLRVADVILILNVVIFSAAAFFLGIDKASYSILTYFTASKSIDYVVEGIEAYTGVTIISGQSDLLKHRLVNELGRGITVYKGERGFLPGQFETSADCDIIFTVVTRLELRRLKNLVHDTDPKAFVFANTIREASGGILRRKQVHH